MTEASTEPPADPDSPPASHAPPDYEPRRIYLNETDGEILRNMLDDPWTPKALRDEIEGPGEGRGREYFNNRMIRLRDHALLERLGGGLYRITDEGRRRYLFEFGAEIDSFADFINAYGVETFDAVLARYGDWRDASAETDEDADADSESEAESVPDPIAAIADDLKIYPDHLAFVFEELEARIDRGESPAQTLFQRS